MDYVYELEIMNINSLEWNICRVTGYITLLLFNILTIITWIWRPKQKWRAKQGIRLVDVSRQSKIFAFNDKIEMRQKKKKRRKEKSKGKGVDDPNYTSVGIAENKDKVIKELNNILPNQPT
eukprot:UN15366